MNRILPGPSALRAALIVATAAFLASQTVPALAAARPDQAERFPERPIRLLVGFAPGGGTDTTARAIAQKLSQALGQQVVIDNRPGAAGNIAAHIVSKANPDGYTLLMGTIAALAINPTLYGNLPFDPVRDFAPITQAVNSTNVLVVHPSVKANNVKDLIALAKASPGKLLYGSSGVGGAGHLAGELFCTMAGVKMTHVPYKGGGPVMIDLLAGQVHSVFATAATALPHIKSGRIRPLGVTTVKRAGMMPDIPTISEQGLEGFDANNWYGLLAPAKTPRAIVNKLNAEVVKVLNMSDIKQYLFSQGLDPAPTTPQEFGAYIKSEMVKWAKVVRAAGASAN
ncbi:MAG: Bug family tripartite tricarboxylate transporter substrate binding protein [Burkholderiales bacterium]